MPNQGKIYSARPWDGSRGRIGNVGPVIRPARPDDVAMMVQLVRDLAEYERAADQVGLTGELLTDALFGEAPRVFALVAEAEGGESGDRGGGIEGMAVWFVNYSTWTGHHGIHLEDLYVRPGARGRGWGRALLTELARIAVDAGYTRVEWSVLDWNEPAIGFYHRLGAEPRSEWLGYRLAGPALARLASAAGGAR